MRNLIAFISKYSFFFLFLILEVFAFYLLFRNNNFQRTVFLNSTNKVSGNIYESYSEWTDYLDLSVVNQQLAKENSRLRENQIKAYQRLFGENIMVNDTIYKRKYFYTKAKVINNSINKQNNYITLDIGASNGVKKGMGVIGPSGVVGVVKDVSTHFSSVLSVLHRSAKISAKLKNTNYFGSMQWNGENYQVGMLLDIPNHVDISKGDTIETSGYSATFPEGIVLGTILGFEKPDGENFYDISIKFINDFKHLTHVYVVKNNYQLEQQSLEEKSEEQND